MATLQEYKCPCCDGAIAFDTDAQKMKCPYCDTEFEMETLKKYDEELKNQTAAKKKAEGDELTDRIADVLTDDFATISDIVKALGDEDVSNQKASYRLGKLVDAGKAVKGELNVGGEGKARKVVAYKLAD